MKTIIKESLCRRKQMGQSVVELALITPLVLIALYIPADFGVAFLTAHLAQNAVREGARIGSGLTSGKPNKPIAWAGNYDQGCGPCQVAGSLIQPERECEVLFCG